MMELRHLRYFCAVAEEKNMTKAAEKLFIAQPPLTRQIRQLEDELEVKLIERQPRGIALTPAGDYFWGQAKQILNRVDFSVKGTRKVASEGSRVFKIGFVPSIFYGQLPLLVRRLRQQTGADIELHELKTIEQIDALKTGKIDIGFGRVAIPSLDQDVSQTLLFREPMYAALPSNHLLANSDVSMIDLAEMPLILYPTGKPPTFANITCDMFTSRGLKVRVTQQVNDIQTALGLVASEMGFTLIPEQVTKVNRDGVTFKTLINEGITSPVFCSRRVEEKSEIMKTALNIVDELVENRISGRYP